MKKIVTIFGLMLAVVLLSGCDEKNVSEEVNMSVQNEEQSVVNEKTLTVLPESVSVEPGANVDQEIANMDKDLQAIDDGLLNQGLADSDLGL